MIALRISPLSVFEAFGAGFVLTECSPLAARQPGGGSAMARVNEGKLETPGRPGNPENSTLPIL